MALSFASLAALVGFIPPRLMDMYDSLKIPAVPEWLRALSRLVRIHPLVCIVAGAMAVYGSTFVDSRREKIARTLLLVITLGAFFWICWFLFSPLLSVHGCIGKRR